MNASTCLRARGLLRAPLVGLVVGAWAASFGAIDPATYPGSVQNPDGTYTYTFRPSGGANNGADQGGLTSGKDTFVLQAGDQWPDPRVSATNYGAADYSHHFTSSCNVFQGWSYFQWDVANLPAGADLVKVVLVLRQRIVRGYAWGYQTPVTVMSVRAPSAPWNEMTLTYANRAAVVPPILAQVSLATDRQIPGVVNPPAQCWFEGYARIDITPLYRDWQSGARPNYGIVYQRDQAWCENANANYVYTSDHANVAWRPALEITYIGGVADTVPPVIQVPGTIEAEATGPDGAAVAFAATAMDAVDGAVPVTFSHAPGSMFPLGATTVVASAIDAAGNRASASFDVIVRDTTAPVLSSIVASPSWLAVPNHKMIAVTLSVRATDAVDATPQARIVSVTSSEPVNGTGDGDTAPDWNITGPLTVELRAERAGMGPGRTYTLTVECADASGNAATGTVSVFVPKNGRK